MEGTPIPWQLIVNISCLLIETSRNHGKLSGHRWDVGGSRDNLQGDAVFNTFFGLNPNIGTCPVCSIIDH